MTDTTGQPPAGLREPSSVWTDSRDASANRQIGFQRRSDAARQLSDLLRSDIVARRFEGPLPYEWDLLTSYATSRNVLRAALSLLKDQGVITRSPRTGTYGVRPVATVEMTRVAEDISVYRPATVGNTFDSPRLSIVHLSFQLVDAPETVRRNLEMSGTQAYFVESLISFDGEPNRIRTSWVPYERMPDAFAEGFTGYIPDAIAAQMGDGALMTRILISAVNADEWTADLLDVTPGAAIFITERLMVLPDGTPMEFGFSRYRGDRTVIDTRIRD